MTSIFNTFSHAALIKTEANFYENEKIISFALITPHYTLCLELPNKIFIGRFALIILKIVNISTYECWLEHQTSVSNLQQKKKVFICIFFTQHFCYLPDYEAWNSTNIIKL
jgi:hypothetical protein